MNGKKKVDSAKHNRLESLKEPSWFLFFLGDLFSSDAEGTASRTAFLLQDKLVIGQAYLASEAAASVWC